MITGTPITTVALGHRALHLAAAQTGHIVALSKEGTGSLIAPDHVSLTRFEVGHEVAGVSIAPNGAALALLEESAMSLVKLPDFAETVHVEDSIEGCLFSQSGRHLWSALHASNDTAVLEIRDAKTCAVLSRVEVSDPFESSGLMLFSHPNEDEVAMWVAGGQDGQCLYWGRFDGSKLTVRHFEGLTDTAPPAFDRSGQRFLVVSGGNVRLYQYPSGPELGRIPWPLEDDPPAESVVFFGEDHAVVHSGNGRLFLVDLRKLQIVEEIVIRGHEPRPVRELFPNLQRDLDPCSDLSTFNMLASGEFLSVHQELPPTSLKDWRDQIITWRVPCT